MKKSLRLLTTLTCNLQCSYCCNNIPEIKIQFRYMDWVDMRSSWFKNNFEPLYDDICISGGEPLLNIERIKQLCDLFKAEHKMYLYTNGLFLNIRVLQYLFDIGINGIRIGIHDESMHLIAQKYLLEDPRVQFLVQDIHKGAMDNLQKSLNYSDNKFKFWHMNECTNTNEDWYVII